MGVIFCKGMNYDWISERSSRNAVYRLWKTKAGEPEKQQCLVSGKGRLRSDVEWNLSDWAGNGGIMGETQRQVVSWHAGWTRWENAGQEEGGSRLTPGLFLLQSELTVLLSNCRGCRGKCLVKGGFEDTLNRSYLCVVFKCPLRHCLPLSDLKLRRQKVELHL